MSSPNHKLEIGTMKKRVPHSWRQFYRRHAWAATTVRTRLALTAAILTPLTAAALLPPWLQHIRSGESFEVAIYRAMDLPGVRVLFPLPPAESVTELNKLPSTPALLSLRARQHEAALDFPAAESDWKAYAAQAPDHTAALLELADFYHRRLAIQPELATLQQVAITPAAASEAFTPIPQQRSWQSFERLIKLTSDQALDDNTTLAIYRAWIARYPQQPVAYARAITWTLDQKRFPDADSILTSYRAAFPTDKVFATRAAALIALRRGGPDAETRALAVYDSTFDPLWPQPLTSSYFSLLDSTHNLRHFLSDANARLAKNPDDLNALGRIFAYNISQQHPEAAAAALDQYRRSKEARSAAWSPAELSTLAQLALAAQDAPLSARYDFALYHATGTLPDGQPAQQAGLANMVALLLANSDKPITLGSGNLSMYRDMAMLDQGPGFWNGVLSLWFNGQSPNNEFASEETKAQPYFHRAKASELLALLDKQYANAPQRSTLHAQLLQAYANYGDDKAVLSEGATLLDQFPNATADFRTSIGFSMADAYARRNEQASEFALYDRLLAELGTRTKNMPLTTASLYRAPQPASTDDTTTSDSTAPKPPIASSKAFELETGAPTATPQPDAAAYAQVLDRYLGRLTAAKKLPEALAVLRKELDRNPNDPALYEKLADFFGQNNMTAQQEQIYQRAIDKFQTAAWTDKLARFYLRTKRNQDYAALTRKVADTFQGTEVDSYFRTNSGGGQQLFVQLNLYAHQKFPHDDVFINNLLTAYQTKGTIDRPAYEKLLRETWFQTSDLTQRFFEFLSSTGKLDSELAALTPTDANPAATREAAEVHLWLSHHEQSAPLFDKLAAQYPTDTQIVTTASDLERSLAWFDPAHTATAVAMEDNLLRAHPGDTDLLARIGDILADHATDSPTSLAPAAAYWRRMPQAAPGIADNYLASATVFWDYFQFDDALAQITAARTHLHNPTLFAYQAGAIAEGKRDYSLAIKEYVAGAIAETADGEATDRLLRLARRTDTRALVESATITAANQPNGVALRLSVLTTQHRDPEATTLLTKSIQSAKTANDVAALGSLAQNHSFQPFYEQALARQADLTTDAIERLQLRYQLAILYEQRNDIPAASRLIDAIYKDNPMLLGVVRSTVDFDWRNKRQPQSITVLVTAAKAAQKPLSQQFLAEAAAKANDSNDTIQARTLALQLLHDDPYSPLYLSLVANSYTRANDLTGLKTFYLQQLDSLRSAQMDASLRKDRTALLRKGLIPALTSARDYDGALQQYIALLSAFPEDPALTNEAALYAQRYDRRQPLLDFYATTTKASPRDSRFFISLAETQALFGDRPAAIDAYAHAIAIRKDRADLYSAKAALEEATQRFDEAVADYQRLYILSYKDRQWMIAVARARARQGRAEDAATALRTAFLTGPKHTPHDYFQIATQLEQWNFLPQAATAAEEGHAAAGSRFLAPDDDTSITSDDPITYVRILTRQRRSAEALAALRKDFSSVTVTASSPSIIIAQVKKEGAAGLAEADDREAQAESRNQKATTALTSALAAMGKAVDTFYTPEEHTTYATLLETQRVNATPKQLSTIWIPAASSANLLEKESAWRKEILLSKSDTALEQLSLYTELERKRLRFAELGVTLEAFAKLHSTNADQALTSAADAYRDAGDATAEARILRTLVLRSKDNTELQQRYLTLLARKNPSALVTVASSRNETLADAATNTALISTKPVNALAAITARGKTLPAVWTPATTALAQLFYSDPTADTSFRTVLAAEATIADRLANKPDTTHTLTGELWFYYAARMAQLKSDEDFLAADLEYNPSSANYSILAQTYAEAGNTNAALTELDHALELNPHDATVQDTRALILWNANRHPEAIESWRAALASLRFIEDRSAAPETFWSTFTLIAGRTHQFGLYAQLKPQMDDVLRIYVKRNGNYRSTELLRAAILSAPTPQEGTQWVLSLASVAVDPATVLNDLGTDASLPSAARIAVLTEVIRLTSTSPSHTNTDDSPDYRLQSARTALLEIFKKQHRDQEALTLIRALPDKQRNDAQFQQMELIFSARTNQLETLLRRYTSDPGSAPADSTLQAAANELLTDERPQPARALLEFAFTHALAEHTATSTQYLALAEVRIRTNDLPGAVQLLQSLTQTDGDIYINLDSAAALLEKTGHGPEAIPFLKPLSASVPWDLSYSARLAEAQRSAPDSTTALTSIARNPLAPYALRTRAARALHSAPATDLGSAELTLLANGNIAPTAAHQPYFIAARVAAATQLHDPKQQAALLREAAAIAPASPQLLLQLFRAEAAAKNTPAAAALLATLRNTSSGNYEPDESGQTTYGESSGLLPPAAVALPRPERAVLANEFATVSAANGDTIIALQFWNLAIQLKPVGADTSSEKKHIADTLAAQRLEAANALRRPVIHKELAQSNIIRTHLTTAPADTTQEEN